MTKTKEELKAIFITGAVPTEADFHDLIEGTQGEQGPQGLKGEVGEKGETGIQGMKGDAGTAGEKGESGTDGADGLSITALELTVDIDGKVTGGAATLSDASTIPITVTTD